MSGSRPMTDKAVSDLPRTGFTDDAEDLALVDTEGNAVERPDAVDIDAEIGRRRGGPCWFSPPAVWRGYRGRG